MDTDIIDKVKKQMRDGKGGEQMGTIDATIESIEEMASLSSGIARDLAPPLLLLAWILLVSSFFMRVSYSMLLILFLISVVGAPMLLPSSRAVQQAYDPLLRLATPAPAAAAAMGSSPNKVETDDGAELSTHAHSSKHLVSLSTPHKVIAHIRQLDLTPLIRVEFDPHHTRLKSPLADSIRTPNITHLRGTKHVIVNMICGPRLLLHMAKSIIGSTRLRQVGHLAGPDIIRLLVPGDRYNFILARHPLRIVLSHVGRGSIGGLYAKHALLASLGHCIFAGEMWIDEDDQQAGRRRIHINNASGTYRPELELLEPMKEFLQEALQIEVQEHERHETRQLE